MKRIIVVLLLLVVCAGCKGLTPRQQYVRANAVYVAAAGTFAAAVETGVLSGDRAKTVRCHQLAANKALDAMRAGVDGPEAAFEIHLAVFKAYILHLLPTSPGGTP